jgi:hypothetical protein
MPIGMEGVATRRPPPARVGGRPSQSLRNAPMKSFSPRREAVLKRRSVTIFTTLVLFFVEEFDAKSVDPGDCDSIGVGRLGSRRKRR